LRAGQNTSISHKLNSTEDLYADREIDVFGKIARNVEAQAYTAEGLKEASDWVYVVIAADVAQLYFDLRARHEKLQILYRNIDAAKKILDLAQTRLERGPTNELDVARAKRGVATLEANVEPGKALIASNGYAIAVRRIPGSAQQRFAAAWCGTAAARPCAGWASDRPAP
jgi:outer membrane protein TolC